MNNLSMIIDGIIIAILLIAFFIGAYRGLMKTVFKTFSSVVSLALAFALHPIISQLVKATPIFDSVKLSVADKLGLSLDPVTLSQPQQSQLIASLPLPDFLNEMLIENNNSVVYDLLDANGINDYICGYIANIIINIAVTIILTIVITIIVKIIIKSMDIIDRLPVIHQLNYLGGGLVGIISGVIIIWLVFMVSMMLVADASYTEIMKGIDGSILGKFLYDNNIFKNIVMGDLFNNG